MSNLPANVSSLMNALEKAASAPALSSNSGKHFIKLAKSGYWAYGADEREVEEGSRWAINPNSFATGFSCWDDGKNLGEEMALLTEDAIQRHQLPDLGAPWKDQVGLQLACISGDDKGVECIYTATSVGGKNAFKEVLNAVLERGRGGHADIVPIVELEVDSYKHKSYGKVFTPVFSIVDWATLDGVVAEAAEEAEEEEEVAPTRRRRRG